jgi:hypothetical protein
MSDQWGPWIEHDGNGCPVQNGTFVEVIDLGRDGDEGFHAVMVKAAHIPVSSWTMRDNHGKYRQALRYRIRKPRGLTMLQDLIADIPQPVAPKVDA